MNQRLQRRWLVGRHREKAREDARGWIIRLGKRLLSVGVSDHCVHFLEVDQEEGGRVFYPPELFVSQARLDAALARADEIYVVVDWVGAWFESLVFPRESKRLLEKRIREVFRTETGVEEPVQVRFSVVETTGRLSSPKVHLSYAVVPERDLTSVFVMLSQVLDRVKNITPMPVTLARTVAGLESFDEGFYLVWLGARHSVFIESTAQGVIRKARSLGFGLETVGMGRGGDPGTLAGRLKTGLDQMRTQDRGIRGERDINRVYLLGDPRLERWLSGVSWTGPLKDVRFRLQTSLVGGRSWNGGENLSLAAGFQSIPEFNFSPHPEKESFVKRWTYKAAMAFMAGLIAFSCTTGFSLFQHKRVREAEVKQLSFQIRKLQAEVDSIRDGLEQIQPFEGWKNYYEKTLAVRPAWRRAFRELNHIVSDGIVLDGFNFIGDPNQVLAEVGPMQARLSGKIKALTMEQAVRELADFRARLKESTWFDVAGVESLPQRPNEEASWFRFQILIQLGTGGKIHES